MMLDTPYDRDTAFRAIMLIGGHEVDAPGFDQDSFERALCRAMIDDHKVHDVDGGHIVTHRGQNGGYFCSRTRCPCKAGEHGQACKHRAMLIFHLDVREPAIRRQGAEARKQVAA